FAAFGKDDPIGAQGFIIAIYAILVIGAVATGFYAPVLGKERFAEYYDDPTRFGIIVAMLWAIFGMFIGDWVAWLLAYPTLTFDAAWASFGRLRPVHTTAVIFGFGGNALI